VITPAARSNRCFIDRLWEGTGFITSSVAVVNCSDCPIVYDTLMVIASALIIGIARKAYLLTALGKS